MRGTVMIVAHGHDTAAAREAASAAGEQGMRVTMNVGAPVVAAHDAGVFDLVVIILSVPASRSEAFVAYVDAIARASRTVVPVRIDGMRPEWMGPDVDKYNCADFSQVSGAARMARWSELFRMNIASYDDFNALRAHAERWFRNGEGDDFLIQDRHRAEESVQLVERMATDPFAHPTEAMRAYAARSLSYAATVRRRTLWSNVRVAVAIILIAAFVAGTILFTRWANQRYAASMQSISRFMSTTEPEFSTFRTIQAAESGSVDESSALASIRDGLSREWTMADVGVENSFRNEYTGSGWFSDDGSKFHAESSGGVLRTWDVATAKPLKAWRVAQGNYDFSVSADGRTAAVNGEDGLRLVDLDNGSTRVIDAGKRTPARVAISSDSSHVMVGDGDHVAMWDETDGLHASTVKGEVLDVRRTDDGLRALILDGDAIHVIGEDTDAAPVDFTLPDEGDEFTYGTIGADGTIVVIDAGKLLVARHGEYVDGLASVGVVTRDAPIGVDVSSDGLAAVSTSQDGVHLIDIDDGIDLGVVCDALTAVTYPAFSRNGLLACGTGLETVIQSVSSLAPADTRPKHVVVSNDSTPHVKAHGGEVSAKVSDAGELTVTTPSGVARTMIGKRFGVIGAITVVSVTPRGDAVAVGTDSGNVIAWDIGTASEGATATLTPVRRWTAPDGASIEALGWNADRSKLIAHTRTGWWSPWSLHGTSTLEGATAAAASRMPICWPSYNMKAFGDAFAKRHGLTACTSAPAASATDK